MRHIGQVLASNLKQLRAERDWRQGDLAEASGLAVESIKKIETNTAGFSRESIGALAQAFGVPESRLFADPEGIPKVTPIKALEVLKETFEAHGSEIKRLQEELEEWRSLGPEVQDLFLRFAAIHDAKLKADAILSLQSIIALDTVEVPATKKVGVKR